MRVRLACRHRLHLFLLSMRLTNERRANTSCVLGCSQYYTYPIFSSLLTSKKMATKRACENFIFWWRRQKFLWHRGKKNSFNNTDKYTRAISRAFSVLRQITSLFVIKINNSFLFGTVFASIFFHLNLSSMHRQAKWLLNPVHPFCKKKKPF